MVRLLLIIPVICLAGSSLTAQEGAALEVAVPAHGNKECPIMGKKSSSALFVDVDGGRIYICCAPCIRKIQRDPARALKAAYPTVKEVGNAACPITGKALPDDHPTVVLQGQKIGLCCAGCIEKAKKHHQLALAKAHDPKLVDVANPVCPIDGRPVADNAIVTIGKHVVHLSSMKHLAKVKEDPKAALEKAKASAEKGTDDEEKRRDG